ncbi:MAG TPA: patatin-like phospholipase family protein [Bacteroidia bacterium]|jgi:NTE family protein|nr:patatin-like phospholipase family protein [Bacteroidia bacterium]
MGFKDNLKIGISLSGGGVRAAVFHLGILSKLADESLLEKIKMISTVSGGTLVTGMIYHANNNKWPTSKEFNEHCIKKVKHNLTKRNLQLNAFTRMILWPYPHFGKGRASVIASSIKYCWGIKCKLNDIPEENPRWSINATTIESGKSWRFNPNKKMGDYILNYVEKPDIEMAYALCSSAAVPYLIGPLKLKTDKFKWFQYENFSKNNKTIPVKPKFKKINIWDGGAYDNLGIESLAKFNKGIHYRDEINFLIVSDAARGINTYERKWFDPMRLIDVTMDQVRSLRARILWDHFNYNDNTGVYFRIGESPAAIYNASTKKLSNCKSESKFSDERIFELKNYPTTLWKMKDKDFEDLFEHGREVAHAALVNNCKLN